VQHFERSTQTADDGLDEIHDAKAPGAESGEDTILTADDGLPQSRIGRPCRCGSVRAATRAQPDVGVVE